MTDADTKLCIAIAKLEKWEKVQVVRGMVAGVPPIGLDTRYPNTGEKVYIGSKSHCLRFVTYLTDPAETVRMEAIKHDITEKEVMHATAEAYKAMLEEKPKNG